MFKCLQKHGKSASILFYNINFEEEPIYIADRLLQEFNEIFDFNMINQTLLKKVQNVQKKEVDNNKKLEDLKQKYEQQITEQENNKKLEDLKQKYEQQITEQEEENNKKLKDLKQKYEQQITEQEEENNKKLEDLKQKYKQQITEQEEENNKKLKDLKQEYKQNISVKEKECDDLKHKNDDQKAMIEQILHKNYEQDMQINELENELNNKKEQIDKLKEEVERMKKEPPLTSITNMDDINEFSNQIDQMVSHLKKSIKQIDDEDELDSTVPITTFFKIQFKNKDELFNKTELINHYLDHIDDQNKENDDNMRKEDEEENIRLEKGEIFKSPYYVVYKLIYNQRIAHVTESPNAKGDIFIPQFISFQNRQYKVTGIEDKSFSNTSIESLSFASNSQVRYIGNFAFSKSTLRELSIPASLRKLEERSLEGANELTDITISDENRYFSCKNGILLFNSNPGESGSQYEILFAFKDFQDKSDKRFDIYFTKSTNQITIKSNTPSLKLNDFHYYNKCPNIYHYKIISQSAIELSDKCFNESKHLQTFHITTKDVLIGNTCFNNCSNLKSISFENLNKAKIGCRAFSGCASLNKFEMSALSTIELCKECFSLAQSLQSLTINSKEVLIGDNCFMNSKSLSSISFRNSESIKIGTNAFTGCESLKELKFRVSSKLEIGEYCFSRSSNLQTVEISGISDLKINNGAFKNCKSLTSITFPDAKNVIFSSHSFAGCNKLNKISIPKASSVCFDDFCFKGASSLSDISFNGSELTFYGDSFDKYIPLTKRTLEGLNTLSVHVDKFIDFANMINQCLKIESLSIEIKSGNEFYLRILKSKSSFHLRKTNFSKIHDKRITKTDKIFSKKSFILNLCLKLEKKEE